MKGYQGQTLSLIFYLFMAVSAIEVENLSSSNVSITEAKTPITQQHPSPLESEEFRIWLEEQEEIVVRRIMEKIVAPNDTTEQLETKLAVARYLVTSTFTAMTKKLVMETLKSGKKQMFLPASAALPASALPDSSTNFAMPMMPIINETGQIMDSSTTTQGPSKETLVFKGNEGQKISNNTFLPSSSFPEETLIFKGEEQKIKNDTSLPSSSFPDGISNAFPFSSNVTEKIATEQAASGNVSETTIAPPEDQRPLWKEILNFNFSAALMGGGEGGGLLNRFMSGNNTSPSDRLMGLLSRLNLPGLGGDGQASGTTDAPDTNGTNDTSMPPSFPITPAFSALVEQLAAEQAASGNGSETMMVSPESQKPLWQEILNFNFTAALMGGGLLNRLSSGSNTSPSDRLMGLLSRLNLPGLGGGGQASSTDANNDTSLPASLPLSAVPASSTLTEQIAAEKSAASENGSETTTASPGNQRPRWQEILNFNFSSALMGGGEGGGLLNRFMSGNNTSPSDRLMGLLNRLNITGLGGQGGGLLGRFNLTGLRGGGENGSLLVRFNLTELGGGQGGNLLGRLNLTGLGGGQGGNLLARLNLTRLGGGGQGGNPLTRFNLTALRGGGGEGGPGAIFSRFNLSSLSGGRGGDGMGNGSGLPFNILIPPEGLFYHPTPPPKNDTVRMSQLYLGNQVEKLMGNINSTNLTGILETSLNIATPNTVGVFVNALLNLVLCNPLDRFNGNCGIE